MRKNKPPKRDCTNCGWGVEWTCTIDYRGEERLKGRCRYQPLPEFYGGIRAGISAREKPATDCPAWKKASQPVPPWGVCTAQWKRERLLAEVREAWDALSPDLREALEAEGLERP